MTKIRVTMCWILLGLMALLLLSVVSPFRDLLRLQGDLSTYVIPLGILGACLVVLTVFTPLGKALKIFMVIAGGSAAGWPISLYLHSLYFPVFPAEPVTYILVFLVLPVVFMVGLLGAAVIGIKQIVGRK